MALACGVVVLSLPDGIRSNLLIHITQIDFPPINENEKLLEQPAYFYTIKLDAVEYSNALIGSKPIKSSKCTCMEKCANTCSLVNSPHLREK